MNGEVVCDLSEPQTGGAFFGQGSPEIRGTAALEAGVPCTVEVTYPYLEFDMMRGLMVGAEPPATGDTIAQAAAAAAAADVAVVVVGTNDDWETEGEDRLDIGLPGEQDELIARVAAANPNTVVVINAGSPVAMPWLDAVPAVMQVWFPGEEFGNSVADVLLGDAEPGGRLPVTIPKRLADTPAYLSHPGQDGRAPYDEGLFIGYRWYDARVDRAAVPLRARARVHRVAARRRDRRRLDRRRASPCVRRRATWAPEPAAPWCSATSRWRRTECTGRRASSGASPRCRQRPVRAAAVEIWLPERAFSVWDITAQRWTVPPGEHHIALGLSSRSLQLAGTLTSG